MTVNAARRLLSTSILGVAVFFSTATLASDTILPGFDLFVTQDGTEYDFQGFAGLGMVALTGNPLGSFDFGGGPVSVGDVDTIVQRNAIASSGTPTIPIEIIELSLQSVAPIDIGNKPEGSILVSLNSPVTGSMTITGLATEGAPHGTFDSGLQFNFDVSGTTSGFLGTIPTTITQAGADWRHIPIAGLPVILGVNRFLNGLDASNDFWPELVMEMHPGPGVHIAGASGPLISTIPTVSEWGMIVMALLGTALATVAIRRQSLVAVGAGGSGGSSLSGGGSSLFMPDRFAKSLLGVLFVVVAGTAWIAASGVEVAARDVAGSLLAAGIAAYILHLWTAPTGNSSEGE